MKIFVDIDNTICITNKENYINASPLIDNINIINELFNKGHEITYWTARGSGTGINWESLTISQLHKWNCLYHNILFHKPIYDIFIDDKAIDIKNIKTIKQLR